MEYTVGKGWHPLVDEATERLNLLGVKVLIHYEKYGTLRFTVEPEPIEATIILNDIEDRSHHVCEMCGASGNNVDEVEFTRGTGGWIKTLCPICFITLQSKYNLEQYMSQHQFIAADKKKVRDFLKSNGAISAYLTRTELHYTDKLGVKGVINRSLLGIQNNFV